MNASLPLPRSFFSFLVLLLVALLSLGREAQARPIRDELPKEAREQWDAARELHDAGDFKSGPDPGALEQRRSSGPRLSS